MALQCRLGVLNILVSSRPCETARLASLSQLLTKNEVMKIELNFLRDAYFLKDHVHNPMRWLLCIDNEFDSVNACQLILLAKHDMVCSKNLYSIWILIYKTESIFRV